MGTALSIFVVLSLSTFVIRLASVALRLTGLSETRARFQALSAFTGTGFTTSEAESVVNYPVRRRIVSLLMVTGNLGLVTVFATLTVSLVDTQGEAAAVVRQLAWLLCGLILLWLLMLNTRADRVLCDLIGRVLTTTTSLGRRRFDRVLQVGDGYSVCEHVVRNGMLGEREVSRLSDLSGMGLEVIAIRAAGGSVSAEFASTDDLADGDTLVMFGPDASQEAVWGDVAGTGVAAK